MRIFFVLFLTFFLFSVSAQTTDPNLGIIPAPKSITLKNGFFTISEKTAIIYNLPADRKIAELFRDLVKENEGYKLVIAKNFIQAPESFIEFNSIL